MIPREDDTGRRSTIPEAPGQMRWFGRHWRMPICDICKQVPTPLDMPCQWCNQPIGPDDRGFMIASVGGVYKPWHFHCLMDNLGAAP